MIGVDIIKVARVSRLAKMDSNHKVFTAREMDYANLKAIVKQRGETCTEKENSLAGMFASKEAFLKAFGMGIGEELALSDIEVGHYESGQPYIVESEKIAAFLKKHNVNHIYLSISHDAGLAIAVVEIR